MDKAGNALAELVAGAQQVGLVDGAAEAIASGIGSIVAQGEGETPSLATAAARRGLQHQSNPTQIAHNPTNTTASQSPSSGGAALTTAASATMLAKEGQRQRAQLALNATDGLTAAIGNSLVSGEKQVQCGRAMCMYTCTCMHARMHACMRMHVCMHAGASGEPYAHNGCDQRGPVRHGSR